MSKQPSVEASLAVMKLIADSERRIEELESSLEEESAEAIARSQDLIQDVADSMLLSQESKTHFYNLHARDLQRHLTWLKRHIENQRKIHEVLVEKLGPVAGNAIIDVAYCES